MKSRQLTEITDCHCTRLHNDDITDNYIMMMSLAFTQVTFDSIGGLKQHVRSLKEMILFPLLYPEVFDRFKIQPPRGVLFYGPPGCGKTLVARALANECSKGGKKVAFFMRKGADCLSKWVGESERQLRLLFDQVCTYIVVVYLLVCLFVWLLVFGCVVMIPCLHLADVN